MNKFNKLYNIIMEDYYAMDPEVSVKFFQSFKLVFNIIEKKIQEDPSLLDKIKKETQNWINKDKATKTHAIFVSFTKKNTLQKYGIKFTPEEQKIIDDADYMFNHIGGLGTYLHHNADKILRLAKRVGIVPKGIPGGKLKHAFHVGKVATESYDPEDMYGGVYEPEFPGEEFELKVDQLFNMMERQIKKNPKLLDTLQWKIDYSVNKGTPIERAILLHICSLLRVQKISFEQKDLIQDFYNYFSDDKELKELLSLVPLLKLAQNIGLNV